MKRILQLLLLLVVCTTASAQTETAKKLYAQANADKSKIGQFLKQDFSAVDSTSMHDLAVMFYRDEDYRSAGACWEVALGKVKKHGKAYEQILNALSSAYMELNDQSKIEWLMEVMEEHNQHELTLDCNDYKCKLERAQYYMMHGDEAKAKEHITESLNLCQTEEQRIEVEEAYAKLLFDIRDFESCAQYYLSASNRWKKLGTNLEHMGADMYWAAQNYMLASKYETAEKCSRQAIESFKGQQNETEKKYYLMSILSLGDALFCQQKYEEALTVYQQELDGYASWMPNTEKHADALEDMAKVETRLKKFEDAKKHYQAALDIYKNLKIDNKYSDTYSSLMVCLRKAGDNDGADQMETEAENRRKAVYQRLLDSELPSLETTHKYLSSMVYTNSLNTIAGCYFGLNQYAKAAEYYDLYAQNLRGMLRERFLLMTGNDRQRVWQEQQEHIDEFCYELSVLPDSATYMMQRFIPTFYDLELLSKGIMLNTSIEFEKVLSSLKDKSLLSMYEQIKANQKEIEELQTLPSEENLQKVLALKQKNTPMEQQLMKGCKDVRDYTEYLSYTWQDVQRKLDDDDVAIEFTQVQMSPLDKDTYLLALVLSSKGEPVMEVVSTRAIIRTMATKGDLYDNEFYCQYIWGTLRKHIDGKKRVFFAPNNMLANIAIEYIKDGDKPFFEKHEVYRLSSTKELCREHLPSESKSMCIIGNVDYNTTDVSETKGGLTFGRLQHSKAEVDGIAKCMKGRYKMIAYEQAKATELNFYKLENDCPAILHVSSHGKYTGSGKTTLDEAMDNSILALSGANRLGQAIENDGIVTANDIAQMNLRQCDMAVLSACQTGLGAEGADGIFGLQRGFKNAGVHTLLMSLDFANDESTTKLMVAFYEGIANGLSKRAALLNAQKETREAGYSEGKYWAPFILLDALE